MKPKKNVAARPKKRTYLSRDDRRLALLKTAAEVVEKRGWPALSMIAVADEAKVSRQLVYQHFESLDELMTETMSQIFREGYERVRTSIQANPGNVVTVATAVQGMTFNLSPGRARALWQMITATYSESAEATRMSRRLRHLLTNLWLPVATDAFGLKDTHARGLIWMLHMAYWGAHQLVEEGELDRATATQLFQWLLTQLQAGSVVAPLKPPAK
jgi:AcrR family transcriptional regulator